MSAHDSRQISFSEFLHPFGEGLDRNNRWIQLSQEIPWDVVERSYAENFPSELGRPSYSGRMALGALIIKERMNTTDRETVEQVRENPYLQFFLGLFEFHHQAPFDASTMVDFRKRWGLEEQGEVNEAILQIVLRRTQGGDRFKFPSDSDESSGLPDENTVAEASDVEAAESIESTDAEGTSTETESAPNEAGLCSNQNDPSEVSSLREMGDSTKNSGRLIIDATCAPADIRYPTDLDLLNEAREKTDEIIDQLHAPDRGNQKRPRTHRQTARKRYLTVAKQKNPSKRVIRKAIGQQIRYLERNLKTIDKYLETSRSCLTQIKPYLYRRLLVISELHRQQKEMYVQRSSRVDDRIVSLSQPHVRPIVRGKAAAKVEFGAKLLISECNGLVVIDEVRWDSFNESTLLQESLEAYSKRFGCYPESVHADKIFRTRANRAFCRDLGIRLSGPRLGRPPKVTEENKGQLKKRRKIEKEDERVRNRIEGRFGQAKRRFTLNRIMAKLPNTSESVIGMVFLVINLEKLLQLFLWLFFLPSWKDFWRVYDHFTMKTEQTDQYNSKKQMDTMEMLDITLATHVNQLFAN